MNHHTASPNLARSLWVGTRGFTILGVAGFLPWALGTGQWLGEGGMFALCALVFVGLSGPLLRGLVPRSVPLWQFQGQFTVAFILYAAIWSLIWFMLRIQWNDYLGLILGTFGFSLLIAWRMGAWKALIPGFIGLASLHTLGYWLGEETHVWLRSKAEMNLGALQLNASQCALLGKLGWGIFYGIGFGAGIGWLYGISQSRKNPTA